MYQCTECHCRRMCKQVIGRNVSLLPEAVSCCLQTCNSCMLIVMVGIALLQSFIVIGITTSL